MNSVHLPSLFELELSINTCAIHLSDQLCGVSVGQWHIVEQCCSKQTNKMSRAEVSNTLMDKTGSRTKWHSSYVVFILKCCLGQIHVLWCKSWQPYSYTSYQYFVILSKAWQASVSGISAYSFIVAKAQLIFYYMLLTSELIHCLSVALAWHTSTSAASYSLEMPPGHHISPCCQSSLIYLQCPQASKHLPSLLLPSSPIHFECPQPNTHLLLLLQPPIHLQCPQPNLLLLPKPPIYI